MQKLLLSNGCPIPENMEIKTVYPMIQFTGQIEISEKGPLKKIMEKNRNEYEEIINSFITAAPFEANAIIGVQVSTTSQAFGDGVFLFMTYIGNPAIVGEIDRS